MNAKSVTEVEKRMEEVHTRIDALKDKLRAEPGGEWYVWAGCKETAALRRASMDLTRALAEMRRPG